MNLFIRLASLHPSLCVAPLKVLPAYAPSNPSVRSTIQALSSSGRLKKGLWPDSSSLTLHSTPLYLSIICCAIAGMQASLSATQ